MVNELSQNQGTRCIHPSFSSSDYLAKPCLPFPSDEAAEYLFFAPPVEEKFVCHSFSDALNNANARISRTILTASLKKELTAPTSAKYGELPILRYAKRKTTAVRKQEKAAETQSSGKGWFDLASDEMTKDNKRDLMLLRLRSQLTPGHGMKKLSNKLPKFFQIGEIDADPRDRARLSRRQRAKSLAFEILKNRDMRASKNARLHNLRGSSELAALQRTRHAQPLVKKITRKSTSKNEKRKSRPYLKKK